MPEVNDRVLISRFQNGDEAALETIISDHKNLLFSFIFRYVRDVGEAEDILSRTFVKTRSPCSLACPTVWACS
ncbi:MAG: DNA-directed RNA polymerase specialized sigma24 family protein [Verrucomicrobiales bacterium]|jgi:DNA-directed RNA polymerase specialized sigma24 family protein